MLLPTREWIIIKSDMTPTPDQSVASLVCTKCKKNPRADQNADATNRHCIDCRTAAAQQYRATRLEQEHGKGFVKGVDSFRRIIALEFSAQGGGMFSGYECAELIMRAPGPLPSAEEDTWSPKPGSVKDEEV